MARTRGGRIGGRGRGRGRGGGAQVDDVNLVPLVGNSNRVQTSQQESSPSSASVGNEQDTVHGARLGSEQSSSSSVAPTLNFENVPRRARNGQPPMPPVRANVVDPPFPPIVHVDATELARTMAIVFTERDRYRKPGDIIEHAKKCGAYDFYGVLDPGQVDRWIKTVEKAFTTLQLSDEEKVSNVYGLLFDKADDWLTRIKSLFDGALTWQLFKEEFQREYLTENFRKEKLALFISLKQGSMTVREYVDKFEDLYKYARDIYPTDARKGEKFRDGLHVSLRGKLNLYTGATFRGWVEKAMEQERLDKELDIESRVKSNQNTGPFKRPWNGNRKSRFSPYSQNYTSMGRNNRPLGSQASVGQPPMVPRWIRNDGIQMGGNIAQWCNICRKSHIGSCRGNGIRCFKCNEMGHYARECLWNDPCKDQVILAMQGEAGRQTQEELRIFKMK